jgi:two-component system chemotaxis response regulator CheY
MRQMVGFTLKGAGYAVLEGGNGKEALDALNAAPGGKVDVIITDLNMPVMDGITFIKEARRLAVLRFTPILMLTTESQDSMKMQGKAAGATGWIVKPFNPEQLLKVLAKVLP